MSEKAEWTSGFFSKDSNLKKFPSKDSFYYISEHSELWKRERLPTKFQPSFSWPLLFSAAGTDFYRLVQHTVETPSKVLPEPRAWCNQPAQQGQSPGCPAPGALLRWYRCRTRWAGVRPAKGHEGKDTCVPLVMGLLQQIAPMKPHCC